MPDRPTCDDLVTAIKPMTARARGKYLRQYAWLNELAGIDKAAEFTGLKVTAVRAYHLQAMMDRRNGNTTGWLWPEPDERFGGKKGSPAWRLRTLVLARASMPGKGRGGPAHRTRYDAATRDWIAGQVLAGNLTAVQAAKDAGIAVNTVRDWVRRARKAQTASSSPN